MPEKDFFDVMGNKVSDVKEKKLRYYFKVRDEDLHEVVDYIFNKIL